MTELQHQSANASGPESHDRAEHRLAVFVAFLAWTPLMLAVLSFAASLIAPRMIFAAYGFAGLFAVTWPFAVRRFRTMRELVSPWGFLVLSVAIGVTARGVYMALGWPDQETLEKLYFRSQPDTFFSWPATMLIVGLALVSIGYFTAGSRRSKPLAIVRYFAGYRVDPKRLRVVVGVLGVLAFLAFLRFAQETGGLNLLAPSAKRATSPGLEVAADYRGLGYLRFVGTLAGLGYLAVLAHFVQKRRPMWPWRMPVLVLLFLNASLIAVYASSRNDIAWLLLMSLAVVHVLSRRVPMRAVLVVVVLTVIIIDVMGAFRSVRGDLEAVDLSATTSLTTVTDSFVLNRNLIDISTTAHVMNAVPEVLERKYGATITSWVVAPIPRELWPSKPRIQSGPEVGILIYGNERAGVPPGFVAEMYWNFHVPGVLVGSLLLGLLLRRLHYQLYPRDPTNIAWVLLYVVGTLRLGVFIMGTLTGQGIVVSLLEVTLMCAVLWLIADRTRWRPRGGTGVAQHEAAAG